MQKEIAKLSRKTDCYERLFAREAAALILSAAGFSGSFGAAGSHSAADSADSRNPFSYHGFSGTEEEWIERYDLLFNTLPGFNPHLCALAFAKELENAGRLPQGGEFGKLPKKPAVCYPKNRFAEQAAEHFDIDADWYYVEDYAEGCNAVAEGKRDGCILPFLSPDGNVMQGMLQLAEEAGLKKIRVLYLNTKEQQAGYLLLSAVLPTLPEHTGENLRMAAEISVLPQNHFEERELLLLCNEAGAEYHLTHRTGGYDFENGFETENSLAALLTLKGEPDLLKELIFAVKLLLRDSTVTGFYPI